MCSNTGPLSGVEGRYAVEAYMPSQPERPFVFEVTSGAQVSAFMKACYGCSRAEWHLSHERTQLGWVAVNG
jgi:hypothetical protein